MDHQREATPELGLAHHGEKMRIGTVAVGPGEPVYIVAEIGGNHNGNLDTAYALIEAAAAAGADSAKFQLFNPNTLYPGRFTHGAVPEEWLPHLKARCHEHGIEFLCSVFDHQTLNAYVAHKPAAIKIASPEAANRELVDRAAATQLPLIISTGAMTLIQALQIQTDTVLLHCVSSYPAPPDEMNLRAIPALLTYRQYVGLSDHTLHPTFAPAAAAALGACLIEKHLTLDRTLQGPDHAHSLEPAEFAAMVEAVRATEAMLGDGNKRVMPSENPDDRR